MLIEKKIIFCFPYKKIGGVSLLFARIAKYLKNNANYKVAVVDYIDGCLAKNSKGVELIEYSDDNQVVIPGNSILILQSMTPWSIFPSLNISDSTKMLFWTCYPFNFIPTVPLIKEQMLESRSLGKFILNSILIIQKQKIIKFINTLSKHESLVFMDGTTHKVTESYLGISINNPSFLPITTVTPNNIKQNKKFDKQNIVINCAWLGRIVDFKVYSLIKSINDLSSYAVNNKANIVFHIIGNGAKLDYLKSRIKLNNFITLKYLSNIEPDDLNSYLIDNIDLMFAMGTSALDSAKLGLPTVLLDISYKELPSTYLYKFLHETIKYSLGDMLNLSSSNGTYSIKEVIDILVNNYKELAEDSIKYFSNNHSIDKISDKLISFCSSSTIEYKYIKNINVLEDSLYSLLKFFTKFYKKISLPWRIE